MRLWAGAQTLGHLKETRAAYVLGLVSETGSVSRKCRFSKADLNHQGSFFLPLPLSGAEVSCCSRSQFREWRIDITLCSAGDHRPADLCPNRSLSGQTPSRFPDPHMVLALAISAETVQLPLLLVQPSLVTVYGVTQPAFRYGTAFPRGVATLHLRDASKLSKTSCF